MKFGIVPIALDFLASSLFLCARAAHGAGNGNGTSISRPRGDFGLKYEERGSSSGLGGARSESETAVFYQEPNLNTVVSILDPRFIEIALGGGVITGQGRADNDGDKSRSSNLSARALILKSHPISGSAHYQRRNIEFEQSPTAVITVDQRSSGAGVFFNDKVFGLPTTLNFNRSTQESGNITSSLNTAGGADQVSRFDNTRETTSLESVKRWGKITFRARLRNIEDGRIRETQGGVTELQFAQKTYFSQVMGYAGQNRAFNWKLKVNGLSQTALPVRETSGVEGETRYKLIDGHANTLEAILGAEKTEQEQPIRDFNTGAVIDRQDFESETTNVGLRHRLYRSLYSELKLLRRDTVYSDYKSLEKSSTVGTRYTKKVPGGNVYWTYFITLRQQENTGSEFAAAANESHAMSDFAGIILNFENVDLASIIVTDLSETITYVENVDYRVYASGRKAHIERVSGGGILNGEVVLIDYTFLRPRGRLEERRKSYSLGTRIIFIEPYIRISKVRQNLLDGNPDLLDPGRSEVTGVKLSYRMWERLAPQYRFERETNTRIVDPFQRLTRSGAFAIYFGGGISSRLSYDRTIIEREDARLNTDFATKSLRLNFSEGRMSSFVGASSDERMVGAAQQEILIVEAGLAFRYGQWILNTSLRAAEEESLTGTPSAPGFERDSYYLTAGLKRRF